MELCYNSKEFLPQEFKFSSTASYLLAIARIRDSEPNSINGLKLVEYGPNPKFYGWAVFGRNNSPNRCEDI